ncbi:MAG: amidase [Bauldia litoralis]
MANFAISRSDQRTISATRRAIASGAISVSELNAQRLSRIEEVNPSLNAFVHVISDEPADRPIASNASDAPQSLTGVAIAVKDNIDVRNVPTTAGMVEFENRIAPEDAACIEKLREAGAAIAGKTNLPEGGLGPSTSNPLFGRTANPHIPERTTGGSSGGSAAAVAAGLCDGALGTDTLGSVRIPASYCGVVGFKPTYGSISTRGVVPLAWSFDTVGVLAGNVDDAAAIFEALEGYDPLCASSLAPPDRTAGPAPAARNGQFRIGLVDEIEAAPLEQDVKSAVDDVKTILCNLGHTLDCAPLGTDLKAVRRAGFLYSEVEAATVHADIDLTLLSAEVRSLLDYGQKAPAVELAKADLVIRKARSRMMHLLVDHDFLITPTMPQTAFDDSSRPPSSVGDFTALASIAHLPAVTLPAGTDRQGLPIGIQIIGRPWADRDVLSFARDLESRMERTDGGPPHRNGKSGARPSARAAMASSKSSP